MRHEDIPDINNPKIIKDVLEGDKLIKEVLNGGYNVHPVDYKINKTKITYYYISFSRRELSFTGAPGA